MSAELYKNSSNTALAIKHSSRNAVIMSRSDTPVSRSGTFSTGELYRNGQYLYTATSTSSSRRHDSFLLGSTSEPAGSVWHNFNNQMDRLYVSNGVNRYSFVPGTYYIRFARSFTLTDPNIYGATGYNFRHLFANGTNTSTISYLNVPTTSRYLVNRAAFTMTSFTNESGVNGLGINWQLRNTSSSVVASGNLFNGGAPNLNQEYGRDFSPTTTQTGNNFVGGTTSNGVSFDVSINNFRGVFSFAIWYTVVPNPNYSLTRLVY
jgi:hypothetical protein